MRSLAAMLGALLLLGGWVAPRRGEEGPALASGVLARRLAPADPQAALIRIRGGAELRVLTRRALDRLFATRAGARLRERLASGELGIPITIELNLRGEDFTRFRVPGREIGETIVFDPWTLPWVDTELGRLRATRETVLAHELAHAVLKLRREDEVIRDVENPVRSELGLPLRVRF
jgi:hypothetical protein